jgi:hypothetical protein
MRQLLALALLATGCATASPTIYPFGPGTFTTHAFGVPAEAREEAVGAASAFCAETGQRSIPTDLTVVALPGQHSVTMVFRCFNPEEEDEAT